MTKKEFISLAENYQQEMYEMAYRIVRNPEDACAAVEAGIISAYGQRDRYWSKRRLKAYLFLYIRNEAIEVLKGHNVDGEFCKRMILSLPEQDSQREELNAAILEMPKDCQNEMILFYYSGLSPREIAYLEDVPEALVEGSLNQGRKILQKIFSVNGWWYDWISC